MTKKKKSPRPNKLNAWFRAYFDETNPDTFLNQTGAAKAAGYKAKTENAFACIGHQNYRKLQDRIEKWMDEIGLSENQLKIKLLSLLDAKETRFFQKDGVVTETRTVEALEIQRRTLDMALKMKGLYAPEKREHSGKGGRPIEYQIVTEIPEPAPLPEEHKPKEDNGNGNSDQQ